MRQSTCSRRSELKEFEALAMFFSKNTAGLYEQIRNALN